MKKIIGLYHHQENNKGNFYNFYPVSVLTDDRGYGSPRIEEIEWGPYVDPDIGGIFPGYHNINIACSKEFNEGEYVFDDASSTFDPQTWGILDVDFAYKHMKSNRGKSNSIPFIDLQETRIGLTENGVSIVIGRNLVDSNFQMAAISFGYDEEFYIKESETQLSGPYIKTNDVSYERCDNFAYWNAPKGTSFLYCDIYVEDESESFDIQVILTSELIKIARNSSASKAKEDQEEAIVVPAENPIQEIVEDVLSDIKEQAEQAEEIAEEELAPEQEMLDEAEEPEEEEIEELSAEESSNAALDSVLDAFVERGALLPSDYAFGKVTITDNEKKLIKKFGAKEFKKDVETPESNRVNKSRIMKDLYIYNAVSVDMENPLMDAKSVGKSEIYFTQLYNAGYISKVNIDGLGEFYRANKRGLQAFESQLDLNFLQLKTTPRDNSIEKALKPEEDAHSFAARLAYTRLMASIGSHTEYKDVGMAIADDLYLVSCANKDVESENIIFGVFAKEFDTSDTKSGSIKMASSRFSNVIRCFAAGVNKKHALLIADTIISYYGNNMTANVYAYALEENKFYTPNGKEISEDDIWSPEVDEEVTKKFSKIKSKEDAIKKKEEAAKKALEEEKKKKVAEERAEAALMAKAEKEAARLETLAKEKIKETLEKQKQVEADLHDLEQQKNLIQRNVEEGQSRVDSLTKQAAEIVKNARKALESPEFARVTMDGELAYHMRKAAAEWEDTRELDLYRAYCNDLSNIPTDDVRGSVISYVVDKILKARPTYTSNDVINIAICIAQGFLTVFSGTPGSGKTSICNLFGQVLGLDIPVGNYPYTRYIPISVGRGWTSQRDFIGYYNPLSKEFDKSNQQVFDAFCIANEEKDNSKYPFVILLDEANLSPMEHYWSEFIRVCDDREKYNTINCGGINTFTIPKTMRFLATINNDDTTTTLSPRMIDRSWIITLPELKPKDLLVKARDFEDDELIRVTWDEFYEAFGPKKATTKMEEEVSNILSEVREILPDFPINNRMYQAMLDYYSAAKECFDPKDNSCSPLDYAVAQRVLPKISGVDGQTDSYCERLKKMQEYLEKKDFKKSAAIVEKIRKRGEDIGFYQFF